MQIYQDMLAVEQAKLSVSPTSGILPPIEQIDVSAAGYPGFWAGLIPFYGTGLAMAAAYDEGKYGWAAFYAVGVVGDVCLARSVAGYKLFVGRTAAASGVQVASHAGGEILSATTVRTIAKDEKIADLIKELAQATCTSGGLEHAIVTLKDGTRVIVRGGPGGTIL